MDQYTERRRANGSAVGLGPTLGRAHAGRTRQHSRRGYPHPTRFSRFLGYALVMLALLTALAVAGAIETAPPAGGEPLSLYEREVALWDGMTPFDRAYYCSMPRRDAVLVWAAGMDEGESDVPSRHVRVAKRVLSRGCPT